MDEYMAAALIIVGMFGVMTNVTNYNIIGIIMFGIGLGWFFFFFGTPNITEEKLCCQQEKD